MLTTAIILGLLIYISVLILYKKLPSLLRNLACKADALLDIAVSVGAFFALGQSVTALIAAAILGIFVSISLRARRVLNNKNRNTSCCDQLIKI